MDSSGSVKHAGLLVTTPHFKLARFEFGQQVEDAGKGARVAADVGSVQLQELLAHGGKARVVGVQVEADAEQAARAVRGLWADDIVGQRRQAVAHALQVERVAEVGRGVDQGAVEIEQHRLDAAKLRCVDRHGFSPLGASPTGS